MEGNKSDRKWHYIWSSWKGGKSFCLYWSNRIEKGYLFWSFVCVDRFKSSLDRPWILPTVGVGFELLILLLPLPQCWDFIRHTSMCVGWGWGFICTYGGQRTTSYVIRYMIFFWDRRHSHRPGTTRWLSWWPSEHQASSGLYLSSIRIFESSSLDFITCTLGRELGFSCLQGSTLITEPSPQLSMRNVFVIDFFFPIQGCSDRQFWN